METDIDKEHADHAQQQAADARHLPFPIPEGRQHGDGCNSPCQKHSRPMRRPYVYKRQHQDALMMQISTCRATLMVQKDGYTESE